MMTRRKLYALIRITVFLLAAASMRVEAQVTDPTALPRFPVPPQGFDQVREGIATGKVERVEYDAPAIGADSKRWMQIYTPPGYSEDNTYPVFYLIHGAGQDERAWVDEGQANVILDNLIADEEIVPMIVVFPNGSVTGGGPGGGQVGAGRGGAAGDGAAAGRGRRGGGGVGMGAGSSFETVLIDDLIPYVESHYSVYADAQQRALAGLSMGGMQTKAIAPGNSERFAYFGIFSGGNLSPTLDITDLATFKKNVKLVYMSFGAQEPSRGRSNNPLPSGPVGIQREAGALNKAGVNAVYYVSPDSAHDFTSWKRSLYYMSQLLFQQ